MPAETNEIDSAGPAPDYNASVDFLKWYAPQGMWVLMAIATDKKSINTQTFVPADEHLLRAWLKEHGSKNIYFHVNPTTRALRKKAEREDVKELAWLHVDIDPRVGEDIESERARALGLLQNPRDGIPKPSAIIFSGGGYQGFWRLEDPMPINGEETAYEEAKLYNLALELSFGADHCHNVDRIMRLPGTINWPDKKKAAKGRVPTLAAVVELNDVVFPLASFEKAPPGASASRDVFRAPAATLVVEIDALDEWKVSSRVKKIIVQGRDDEQPLKGSDQSRSAWQWFVIHELLRAGVPETLIQGILVDPRFAISERCREQGSRCDASAMKQIEKAKAEQSLPALEELNARHAVVNNYGGKTMIMTEGDPPQFQSFENFSHRYSNRLIELPNGSKRLSAWWISHPLRRTYETVDFLPGIEPPDTTYNLWRGWSVHAQEGNCSRFLEFVQDVICGGKRDLSEWLLNWMAHLIQRPCDPSEVALVLKGGQGIGKSFFAKKFGELFGRHFVPVTDPQHVVGHFNKILHGALLVFSDEAFGADDKRHAGVLKALVTEGHITIEPKGVDAFKARKYFRLILASNERWVVPADLDDRRFLVLDVDPARKNDRDYFRAIEDEWNSSGREALMAHLSTRDISEFDQRARPATSGLVEQMLHSLRGARRVIYDLLASGEAPKGSFLEKDGHVFVPTRTLAESAFSRVSERALADELLRVFGKHSDRHQHRRGFWLPPLGVARIEWAAFYRVQVPWPADDQLWIVPPFYF